MEGCRAMIPSAKGYIEVPRNIIHDSRVNQAYFLVAIYYSLTFFFRKYYNLIQS